MANRKPNFSQVLYSLASVFKSASDDKMDDLADALDIEPESDMFNAPDKGNRARTPTGPQLSASGRGAEAAIEHYSPDDGQPSDSVAQAYQALADRLEKSEAAIKAMATLLFQMTKADSNLPFPRGEAEDDDESSDDDDDSDVEKSGVRSIGGVPNLMRRLSTASRSTGKLGLAPPPNMATIRKAGNSLQNILDSDASIPDSVRVECLGAQQLAGAVARGAVNAALLGDRLAGASRQAQIILAKAGIG